MTGAVRRARDYGSGGIWVLGGAVLICGAALLAATMAAVAVARHAVATAADQVALAAADLLPSGSEVACARGGSVAGASGVDLERCVVGPAGIDVTVTVSRPARGLLAAAGRLRASARAGRAPDTASAVHLPPSRIGQGGPPRQRG